MQVGNKNITWDAKCECESVCACMWICKKRIWVCLQFFHPSRGGCGASEVLLDGPAVRLICCLWVRWNCLQNSSGYKEMSTQTFSTFLIYFINEIAPRCAADVVFCDADEPFGAVQLLMSSVYCYKIGLPGNNHLHTQITNPTVLRQDLDPLRQWVKKSYSF